MKITLEPYCGGSYTSENEAEHISAVVEMFKGLLVASGYHPSTVDEYVPNVENGDWFVEADEAKVDAKE